MNKFIDSLIKMRTSSSDLIRHNYVESFKTASQFLISNDEFIPYNLIELSDSGKLKEISKQIGNPVVTTKYDKHLSNFYKKYSLKRDINHIVDSIAYLIIPTEQSRQVVNISNAVKAEDFYHIENVLKLAKHHSQPYHANDEQLKQIGEAINSYVLQPTHKWLEEINIIGFDKAPERYWQVAGAFKKRIWGKLQHPEHLDKKVFLCLGVDLENKSLFYGLECLRTGTSKLSTEQIFKFDHITKNVPLVELIPFDQLSNYNWEKLILRSERFLLELIPWYDKIIDYIWNDNIDIKSIQNQLIPMLETKPVYSGEPIISNKKLQSQARDMVIAYEKTYLKYKQKNELSKKLLKKNHSNEHFDVISYHLDGSEKLIKVIASKSSSINGAIISQSYIEASIINPDKSFIYIITNISNKRKSGMLHISKGRFDKIFQTKPERHRIVN